MSFQRFDTIDYEENNMDNHEITFKGVTDYEGQSKIEVDLRTNAVTLSEILPVFKQFLLGMGFCIKGELEIVNEEED